MKRLSRVLKRLTDTGIPHSDIYLYFAVLVVCYFCFVHGDIALIGSWSYTFLNGHFVDFYEVNVQLVGCSSYLPSTSLLYSVWNLPIRLLGIVTQATVDVGLLVLWYKLLTTLFFAGAAFWVYRIGKTLGLTQNDAVLMMVFWIASPILFFSQFIFSQTDIFTVFFVIAGIYFFLQKKIWLFVLFMGISFTFKYYSLLIFLPLLLLVEKNPVKLLGYLAVGLAPLAIEVGLYLHSSAFISEMTRYGFFERMLASRIPVSSQSSLYLFPVIWLLVCGFSYFSNPYKTPEFFFQMTFYIPLVIFCAFFCLVLWHPQYLLLITPFLAITTFKSCNVKKFLLLDFLLMFACVGYIVCFFYMNVDQTLMRWGVLGNLNPGLDSDNNPFSMATLFTLFTDKRDFFSSVYFNVIWVMLVLNIILKFPGKWQSWFSDIHPVPRREYWNYLRLSFFGGTAAFVLPALAAYILTLLKNLL